MPLLDLEKNFPDYNSYQAKSALLSCQHVLKNTQRVCLIGTNSENGRLSRLRICVRSTLKFRKQQVWQVCRPAESSAPKDRRFGRLGKDFRFNLRNSKNEVTLLTLLR